MVSADLAERPEVEAFERMRLRMRALPSYGAPHLDPRALAMRALLVTDRLGQTDMLRRVDALGRAGVCEPRSVDDLRMAARSLMHALGRRGDVREMASSERASGLRAEALRLRAEGLEAIDLLDSDEARLWIDVFRLPSDDLELVHDLRSMAQLFDQHRDALGARFEPEAKALAARTAADALERCLTPRPDAEWDEWVGRAFTLTLTLYAEVSRIGQVLRDAEGLALGFPSPAGLARAARRNRGPTSSIHPVHRGPPPLQGAPTETRTVSGTVAAVAAPPPLPRAAATTPTAAQTSALPPTPTAAAAPNSRPHPSSPPPSSASSRRRGERLHAELEVSLFSDSNFYVGFTENVSEGGLFVATYLIRPLGSRVEMSVRIPHRDDPLILRGKVRWVREYSVTSDGCPGMGIQFDAVSESEHADIAAFLAKRDPLFFAD